MNFTAGFAIFCFKFTAQRFIQTWPGALLNNSIFCVWHTQVDGCSVKSSTIVKTEKTNFPKCKYRNRT